MNTLGGCGVWGGGCEHLEGPNWGLERLWSTWAGELQAADRSVGNPPAVQDPGCRVWFRLSFGHPLFLGFPGLSHRGLTFPHPDVCEKFPLKQGLVPATSPFCGLQVQVWAGPFSCRSSLDTAARTVLDPAGAGQGLLQPLGAP